jgi:DnaJ-domain-containing protein 1
MRKSEWGYPTGTKLKVIKLPNPIAEAVQSAKFRMSGEDLIKLLNHESITSADAGNKLPNAVPDDWQTIPLSDVLALSKCIRYQFDPNGDCYDSHHFDPFRFKTVKSFRAWLTKEVREWTGYPRRDEYIEAVCAVYGQYLALIAPMMAVLRKVDPVYHPSSVMGVDPTKDLLEHSLIFDDVNAQPATLGEVLTFLFEVGSQPNSIEELRCDAISYNRPDILAAIGLNNGSYQTDRYQHLLQKRRASLGNLKPEFAAWAKDPAYAVQIHPLMPKMFSSEELRLIRDCVNAIQFGGFTRAFGRGDLQDEKEREAGDKFRQWFRTHNDPDSIAILTDILGVDYERLAKLGLKEKDYHTILGISPNADRAEINQAYRKLAAKHHPDKGGDVVFMQKLNRARNEALLNL